MRIALLMHLFYRQDTKAQPGPHSLQAEEPGWKPGRLAPAPSSSGLCSEQLSSLAGHGVPTALEDSAPRRDGPHHRATWRRKAQALGLTHWRHSPLTGSLNYRGNHREQTVNSESTRKCLASAVRGIAISGIAIVTVEEI